MESGTRKRNAEFVKEGSKRSIWKKYSNDNKINKQILKKDINEQITWAEETALLLAESIPVKRLFIPLPAMNANAHWTAMRVEKRHWQ